MGALTLLLAVAAALPAASAPAPSPGGGAEIALASRIVDKKPEGAGFQFASQDSVYCWTRVRGENGRTIRHVWKRGGRVIRSIALAVKADDFRTWSKKDALWPGHWTVAVEDEDGHALGPETSFIVADAFEAGPGYTVEIRDVSESRLEAVLVAADSAAVAAYAPDAAVVSVTGASGKAFAPASAPGAKADALVEPVPGEKPQFVLPLPAIPRSERTFDLSFKARLFGPGRADRSSVLTLRGVPNPARLEDWAAARRLPASAASENRAAR